MEYKKIEGSVKLRAYDLNVVNPKGLMIANSYHTRLKKKSKACHFWSGSRLKKQSAVQDNVFVTLLFPQIKSSIMT